MNNQEILKRHIEDLYENLAILDELKSIPLKQFKEDKKTIKISERCLQLSIQCLLDISHYIITNNNFARPKDNREAILTLGAKGIIPKDFANKISPMAGLRNLLVHEYTKIDPARIYEHIHRLENFRDFSRHILKYIEKH